MGLKISADDWRINKSRTVVPEWGEWNQPYVVHIFSVQNCSAPSPDKKVFMTSTPRLFFPISGHLSSSFNPERQFPIWPFRDQRRPEIEPHCRTRTRGYEPQYYEDLLMKGAATKVNWNRFGTPEKGNKRWLHWRCLDNITTTPKFSG